jgi:tRNA pseudouridine55 synthase
MDGIINIYKEPGFTSHDVVAKLRGILHQKKIGHTGTLDPDAAGVLPVCCGKATKICSLLTDKDKTYHAVCQLGIETDTQDISGSIIRECRINSITADDIINCVKKFKGNIMQVPPMYSALKVNGKKLYELAREGKTVERKPRQVNILSIEVSDINLDSGTFAMDITCSKGTYIRTLCHDIGISLGTAAAMANLVRTRVSVFKIEDAVTLGEVQYMSDNNPEKLKEYFMPADALFTGYKKVQIKSSFAGSLANGNKLSGNMFYSEAPEPQDGENILVYNENGVFKAIYQREAGEYKVNKMF